MKKLLFASLVLLSTGCSHANVTAPVPTRGQVAVRAIDGNLPLYRRQFADLDRDTDKALSAKELTRDGQFAALVLRFPHTDAAKLHARIAGGEPLDFQAFYQLRIHGDGYAASFEYADKDGNGTLSPSEYPSGFAEHDTNHDGRLTFDEFYP
jgi:hypothetical protein